MAKVARVSQGIRRRAPLVVIAAALTAFLAGAWFSGPAPTTASRHHLDKVRISQTYRSGEATWQVEQAYLRPHPYEERIQVVIPIRITNHSSFPMPLEDVVTRDDLVPIITLTGRGQESSQRVPLDEIEFPDTRVPGYNPDLGPGLTVDYNLLINMSPDDRPEDIAGNPIWIYLPEMVSTPTRDAVEGFTWQEPRVTGYVALTIGDLR